MAIVKKPSAPLAVPTLERFIEGAPDGTDKSKADTGEGVQITLRMSKSQLERITTLAKRQGIPRASYMKRAVFIQLEEDEGRP